MSFNAVAAGDLIFNGSLKRTPQPHDVYDYFRHADTTFVNLEVPLTTAPHPAEKLIALKAPVEAATTIHDLGIDVVTVANNHGMDYGEQGLMQTLQVLDDAGVRHVGGGKDQIESFTPVYKEHHGIKVAYLGFTTTLPNGSNAGSSRPGVAGVRVFTRYVIDSVTLDETPGMSPFAETVTYGPDEDFLLEAIRSAKRQADLVLVAVHWGVPYGWVALSQGEIASYQRPLAHAIVDAGASAIFGHHPHVVHGVEFHKCVPIFYSLGNLLFHDVITEHSSGIRSYPPYKWASLQSRLSNIGALAHVSWSRGRMAKCSIIPVTLDSNGEPLYATESDADLTLDRLRALSKDAGVVFKMEKLETRSEIVITPSDSALSDSLMGWAL